MNKLTYLISLIAVSLVSFIGGREHVNYELKKELAKNDYEVMAMERDNHMLAAEYNRCVFMEWETAFNLDSCEHGWEEDVGPMCMLMDAGVPRTKSKNWSSTEFLDKKQYD